MLHISYQTKLLDSNTSVIIQAVNSPLELCRQEGTTIIMPIDVTYSHNAWLLVPDVETEVLYLATFPRIELLIL